VVCRLKTPLKKQTRSTKFYTEAAAAIHTYPRLVAAAAAIHVFPRAAAAEAAAIHVYPRAAAGAAAIHVYPRAAAAAAICFTPEHHPQQYTIFPDQHEIQSKTDEPYYMIQTNTAYTFYVPDQYDPTHFFNRPIRNKNCLWRPCL
jgi:hypothetical protein